jgi:hypothetical protein
MNLFNHTTLPQKIAERMKDYKMLLTGQVAVLINYLVVYQIFVRYPFPNSENIFLVIMMVISIAMNVIAYTLLSDLTNSKFIRYLVIVLISLGIFLAIFVSSPFAPTHIVWLQRLLVTLSPAFAFSAFSILMYLMIYDIFKEKHDILYRLWGSASIFLLIGVLFGTVFFILEIIFPEEYGLHAFPDIHQFIKCYTLSFYTLSGVDQPFENLSVMVRNICVIESIFSNLYIILLVGRLLSK